GETALSSDAGTKHSGKGAAKLQSDAPAKSTLVSPPFAVTAGDELRFAAWGRGGNAGGEKQGIQARLAFPHPGNQGFQRALFFGGRAGRQLVADIGKCHGAGGCGQRRGSFGLHQRAGSSLV